MPTVSIVTRRFEELAQTTAFKKGIPNLKVSYTPHPITDRPAELCDEYLQGNNPVSGKPLVKEIADGLAQKLSAEDMKSGFLEREPRPRLLAPGKPADLERMFHDNGWTDGLPIVMPTEERVAAMLKGTSHKPDEVVGVMRPSPPHEAWQYTVEMVAANAVMAGARPEYLPTILAIASTGVTSLFSSTSSFARMVVVNGPVRNEIGMNTGIGALGPFNHANSTIGRAWTLISKNLGGSGKPGETFLGSQGNALTYNNLCFPETEEGLPEGWQALHVQKGFKPGESVVSVFSGWSLNDIAWYSPLPQQEVIKNWLTHFFSFGTNRATLLLDPVVSADLKNNGFKSKEEFSKWLSENSKTPGWLYWSTHQEEYQKAKAGVEPYASYLKLGEGDEVPVSRYTPAGASTRADALAGAPQNPIEIVTVGGGTNTFWSGGDFSYVASASVDKWK
ncbi:MAG TPA: UGSC family (seleno)protein [Gammaproteobacteria bacterium]|nr:UGSC family (seleno)protein [Gammaproteobacteria bacterium]